jgi:hypothetical protein
LAFVLLVLIEISQGYKTFEFNWKFYIKNYSRLLSFLKNSFEKNQISKCYFDFIQTYASLLAQE